MSFHSLEKSFDLIWKYPILFLPDLVYLTANAILFYAVAAYTGLSNLQQILQAAETLPFEQVKSYFIANIGRYIIGFLSFFLVTFILGSGAIAVRFSLIRNVLVDKRVSFSRLWKEKKQFVWRVILVRLAVFCVAIIALLALLLVSGLLYVLFKSFIPTTILTALLVILVALLALAIILFFSWSLLFRYPVLFFSSPLTTVQILKKSFETFQKRSKFVLVSWSIVVLFAIGVALVSYLLNATLSTFSTVTIITIIASMVVSFLRVFVDVLTSLYLCLQFSQRSGVKE